MKKVFLLKLAVIIVPVLIGIFAEYNNYKKQKQIENYCIEKTMQNTKVDVASL